MNKEIKSAKSYRTLVNSSKTKELESQKLKFLSAFTFYVGRCQVTIDAVAPSLRIGVWVGTGDRKVVPNVNAAIRLIQKEIAFRSLAILYY